MASIEDTRAYFNPNAEFQVTRNRLGHWNQVGGALYFLTFRLADSLPAEVLNPWREQRAAWLRLHPPPHTEEQDRDYHARFTLAWETALDAGHGACVLRDPRCAQIVLDCLLHFEGVRTRLHAAVIMPNHVHALLAVADSHHLEPVITGLKGVSSRLVNRLLNRTGHALWQKDYFDRLIRDDAHYARCVRYIANNPAKARLSPTSFLQFYSDGAAAILPPK